jgi:drug/metabolite transporter, DME family
MSTHRAAARLGLFQICLAAILWGTGGVAVQLIRERTAMSVLTLSAYRMVIAAVVLLVVLILARRLDELRLTPRVVFVGACTGMILAAVLGLGTGESVAVHSTNGRDEPTSGALGPVDSAHTGCSSLRGDA